MLIYRLVSWIFISAIGWVVFFFMFRTESTIDPDVQEELDVAAAEQVGEEQPATDSTPDPADTALQGPLPPPERHRHRDS
jgi:hypothetical protein